MSNTKNAKQRDSEIAVDFFIKFAIDFWYGIFFCVISFLISLFSIVLSGLPIFAFLYGLFRVIHNKGKVFFQEVLIFYIFVQSLLLIAFLLFGDQLMYLKSYVGISLCVVGIYVIQAALASVIGFRYTFRRSALGTFMYVLLCFALFLSINSQGYIAIVLRNGTLEHFFVEMAYILYLLPLFAGLIMMGIGPH